MQLLCDLGPGQFCPICHPGAHGKKAPWVHSASLIGVGMMDFLQSLTHPHEALKEGSSENPAVLGKHAAWQLHFSGVDPVPDILQ